MFLSAQELASNIGARIQGNATLALRDVAPLESAEADEISYGESRKQLTAITKSAAAAVLVTEEVAALLTGTTKTLLIVAEPQRTFIQVMLLFRPPRQRAESGISPQALVHPSFRCGEDCIVHPGAQIAEGVVLGNRCEIGPGVIVGADCTFGDDCQIYANAVLYPNVHLRNRVIVHAGAVLGADGFGYRFAAGRLEKIPHTGMVILEDDVEIGACATIDRGMIEATIIGQGTKLDNQVMIAHNCRIGRHNAFASQVGLAGSCTTGDYVQMGGQVGVADHVNIGSGLKFGGKAGVIEDMLVPGMYHGVPAISEKDAIRNHLVTLKLPAMRDQIKKVTSQIETLQAQLAALLPEQDQRAAA
ncbi:UDP-3-O-(3-hydroxymyristoyl)glucosamine N-acyltransferase [Planctomicrobium sp. SH664]|uniref:UDP-3-O-(3-hydroxymyristoyl)glucosamine N-acyltransferase n=1 Tax=Planctomicrobium sp. SH664 TaxID=3448125 RepID=UPI003F5C485C